ncbi:hypothetical protein [Alteromonas sp.]|jgi:hypothetical protein|uniref:hypothetical protein n=1 Tax=Alteromonas sp. TaxID=232 RepID=UPI00257C7E20|nr:hypothetical protein [Alteromonas sp.]MEA3380450.1 hypothetical protein [Pseudomonadota bacterium]NQY17621.1 hypothetical protein [Alteromonas sp.]|tara:strand:+ start:556 stop:732 length:177 start_codon:yes stop_codon:yes gene_type:complete
MKALLGDLAKKIKDDVRGNKELREFLSDSTKESQVITLSDGKKYRVSTSPIEKKQATA